MLTFEVNDMTCGHCVATITRAVQAADPGARVEVDLASRRVRVEPAATDAGRLRTAISAAGYTPRVVEDAPVAPTPATLQSPSCSMC
jgi:copper chaperone